MATAVIVDAVRTAGGKRYGKLSGWHAADLAAETLKALAERNNLDPALVEDVIMGCVMQVGNQSVNVGRSAVLAAGWPEEVPATTIDRQCGSSQQSVHFAAQGVIAGAYDIVVAAGVEVMSTTPMGASVTPGSFPMGPKVMERYAPRGGVVMQGTSAELIAQKWDITREDMDAFAVESHKRAAAATAEGRFDNEIIAVAEKRFDRETGQVIETGEMVTADEGIRPDSSMESLAKLKREVPDDVLVLPSHNECFRGLHARLDYLGASQGRTLDRLRKTLKEPRRAVDVFAALFGRAIDESDAGLLNLATGESLACLNYLWHRGEVRRSLDGACVAWYQMEG